MSKNERTILVCASNSNEYGVISQYINGMTPHNDVYLSGFDNEHFVSMIFVEEDGSLYDAETFDHLEAISLITRPLCILNPKHGQIDVKIIFINIYWNVTVDINNLEGVNMRDSEDLLIDTMLGRITKHCVQQMLSDLEMSMVEDVSCLPDFQVK